MLDVPDAPLPDSARRASTLDPEAALAAALRECLMDGTTVTLPGLGTLRPAHEPARVEEHEDGHRVLLPPSETIRFEPT